MDETTPLPIAESTLGAQVLLTDILRKVQGVSSECPSEPAVEPGFPRAMVKRKPDSGPGYIAAANSP